MAISLSVSVSLLLMFLSQSTATPCNKCVNPGKATRFSNPSPISAGVCGYGSLASGFYGGKVSAASSALLRDGDGCGACFHLRCTDEKLCSTGGTNVVVTDLNKSNATDFTLSLRAIGAMALAGKGNELNLRPTINIEYKRVPCEYKNRNLSVMVERSSSKPRNLVIKFLYQGGQTDILTVDVLPEWSSIVTSMSQKYGPVWETSNAPAGSLQFRLVVKAGYDWEMFYSKTALPDDWKIGVIYDLGMQIPSVAQDGCSPCDPAVGMVDEI